MPLVDIDPGTSAAEPLQVPAGVDRRRFMMRSAAIGAAAVMTGQAWTPEARANQAAAEAKDPALGATLSPAGDRKAGA